MASNLTVSQFPNYAIGMVAGLAMLLAPPAADAAGASCRHSLKVVAPCFTVHGLLREGEGAPSLRISRMGNLRVFGVVGDDGASRPDSLEQLPSTLRAVMQPPTPGFAYSVYGNFRVCPLTRKRPGWMRLVCIERATHVVLAKDE